MSKLKNVSPQFMPNDKQGQILFIALNMPVSPDPIQMIILMGAMTEALFDAKSFKSEDRLKVFKRFCFLNGMYKDSGLIDESDMNEFIEEKIFENMSAQMAS